jgi:hypothetical protein
MPDLSGVRAKLESAAEHRRAYDGLFESYLASHPYSIAFEFDPDTGWHTFRWRVTAEPPLERLALIFSDIVGNRRSTLDYLVWQLVLLGGRKPGRKTCSRSSSGSRTGPCRAAAPSAASPTSGRR